MKQTVARYLWFLVLAAFCCGTASAQFSGAIEGTVTDNTGAIVPGAQVVLTNESTGVANTTEANSDGIFHFPSLGPGTYKVTVTVQGFASVSLTGIVLNANSIRDASVKLQPSSVTTNVQVEATPSAVETDEAKISSVIDAKSIAELPIQGRNVYAVTNQTPGVTGAGMMGQNAANADIFFATTTPAIVANGAPNHSNTYLLDGVSLDDSPSGGDAKLVPNPDSVDEVVVSTSNYSAEFGKAASLVTQITSKSGTNSWHGSSFYQYQSSKLTARTEFQNAKDPLTGLYITPYHRDEFGGSFGGPIIKDKTFFFVSYDQVVSNTSSAGSTTVEAPDFVNFMNTNFPSSLSTTLLNTYKPTVGPATGYITVGSYETSQLGLKQCDPTLTVSLGMPCNMNLLETANGTSNSVHNGRQYNVRLDQAFPNQKDRIYGNMYNTHLVTAWDNSIRQAFDINFPQDAWFGAVNYTHVFSPTILNEAAMGYTRTSVIIPCKYCDLLPVNIGGIGPGFGDGFSPVGFAQNDYHLRDMLSITRGKHAIKTASSGSTMRTTRRSLIQTIASRRGASTTSSISPDRRRPITEPSPSTRRPAASATTTATSRTARTALLSRTTTRRCPTSPSTSACGGTRSSNPREAHGNLSTLTLGSGSTLLEQIAGVSVGLNPDPSKRRPFIDHKKTYFAPRFGFAYRPFGLKDWSVRGGRRRLLRSRRQHQLERYRDRQPSDRRQLQRQCAQSSRSRAARLRTLRFGGLPIQLPASVESHRHVAAAQSARRFRERQQHRRPRSAPEDGLCRELLLRRATFVCVELDRRGGLYPLE